MLVLLSVFIACTREKKDDISNSEAKYVSPTLPTTSDPDLINDHKRFIALGMAELVNNNTMADLPNSINNIHDYLDLYASLDLVKMSNIVHTTNSAYLVPNVGSGNELGDAINYAINASSVENGNIVALNNNTWDWDMLEGYVNAGKTFGCYLELPDFQSLTQVSHKEKWINIL